MAIEGDKIIINEWETGIGESSAKGFLEMRNCDPFRKPGYLETSFETVNGADNALVLTVTVNTTTDIMTSSGSVFRFGGDTNGFFRAVTFTTTGTLPAPLVAGTVYYINNNTSPNNVFQISTTLLNAINNINVDFTTTGTGTHTMTTVNMGTPTALVKLPVFNIFSSYLALQDSNNRIWIYNGAWWIHYSGNTLTGGFGGGLAVWNGFLFAFRNATVDILNLNTGAWTNSFHTLSVDGGNVTYHKPFVSTDGVLYFYSDQNSTLLGPHYVGSVVEETVFDPTDSATYTWNNQALDLPDSPTCFEDLIDNLVIGTENNLIYPWDRTSSSYEIPITLLEPNVTCMKSFNNILYFSSGVRGNIYYTYGTTIESFLNLSDELTQAVQYTSPVTSISFNGNELLFYVSGSTQLISGLYSANLKTGAYHLKYKASQGYGVSAISYVYPAGTTNDIVFMAYFLSGVAYVDTTAFITYSSFNTTSGYISYCITPLYEVGTFEQPRTFQKVQLQLARPFGASSQSTSGGGSVRISSRQKLEDAFTQVATFDSTNMSTTRTALEEVVNQEGCQFIQFKIELQASATTATPLSSRFNTPTIKSVIIY